MNRFIDTGIWEKPWFRKLAPEEKEAWRFITEKCDNVGVWVPDFELAEFYIGAPVQWDHFVDHCNGNIEVLENGKWWIVDFVAFQHGDLLSGSKSNPCQSYVRLLKKHGLYTRYPELFEAYGKPSQSLCEGSKEKEKERVQEKARVKARVKDKEQALKTQEDKDLYHEIIEACQAKSGPRDSTDYKREGPAVKRLIALAHENNRGDPRLFVGQIFKTFEWLKERKRHDLFKDKPFRPSIVTSAGLWPHVKEAMAAKVIDHETAQTIGELFT